MGAAQCQQPAFDGVLGVFRVRGVAQALRGNGAHRGQGILDPVMKLFQDQLLQLVGCFALPGVDAGLSEQRLSVDFRLCQQKSQADIFCSQQFLRKRQVSDQIGWSPVDFEHTLRYHYMFASAHIFWTKMPLPALKSGMADHILHLGDHFAGFKRLSEKAAVGRNVAAG